MEDADVHRTHTQAKGRGRAGAGMSCLGSNFQALEEGPYESSACGFHSSGAAFRFQALPLISSSACFLTPLLHLYLSPPSMGRGGWIDSLLPLLPSPLHSVPACMCV